MDPVVELLTSNRVVNAFERQKAEIERRLHEGIVTQERVDETHKAMDMSFEEFVRFQELKSLAQIEGILTFEEATSVYAALGETVEHFNSQPVHIKAVLTKLFADLLHRRVKRGC